MRNPGLERFFMEAPMAPAWASILPHGDHVVLGGGQRRSDDTTPDPAEEADVLARCVAIEPALAAAEVLEHTVGLRPGRAAPRVAAERRGDTLVVHNYGHAGNGVMLSWGCARDAAALALGAARLTGQDTAVRTSSATFFSTSGLHRTSANDAGHMSPSSRFAASWKPSVE